eukprot:gene2767-13558_t
MGSSESVPEVQPVKHHDSFQGVRKMAKKSAKDLALKLKLNQS